MSTKTRPAPDDPSRANAGIVATVQEVTDGFLTLARTHMELAKAEARQEVKAYAQNARLAAIGGLVAALGFVFLNAFGVLLAAMLGGLTAAVVTAGVLGGLYLMGGLAMLGVALRNAREREAALQSTRTEIKRSSTWVKEIADNS